MPPAEGEEPPSGKDLDAPLLAKLSGEDLDNPNTVAIKLQMKEVTFTAGKGSCFSEAGGGVEILHAVNAGFDPGQVTAMLGPSGAGKTTVLNVLSGHAGDFGRVSGHVLANGRPIPADFRKLCCLVPQEDVLLPGLTVRQTLLFAAALRLDLPAHTRTQRVDGVMSALGLLGCADVLVGSVDLRGISGGQKKRTSIALELLTNPPVMFLDEPTSGLDSKMAEDVSGLLRLLAQGDGTMRVPSRKGSGQSDSTSRSELDKAPVDGLGLTDTVRRTIVCTIHQPSFQIFQNFDRVLLIAQGRVAYAGGPKELVGYLEGVGLACPPFENPADHAMRLLQEDDSLDCLLQAMQNPHAIITHTGTSSAAGTMPPNHSTQAITPTISTSTVALEPSISGSTQGQMPADPDQPAGEDLVAKFQRLSGNGSVSVVRQFVVLFLRYATDFLRDPGKLMEQAIVRVGVGSVLGIVWLNQAGSTNDAIFPVQGVLFASCVNGVMDSMFQTALLIPQLRALSRREFRNGYYAMLPMHIALFCTHAIAHSVTITCLAFPVYFMVGLQPTLRHFLIFLCALFNLVWLGVAFGLAVGAKAKNFQEAQALVTPIVIPMIIFSGYLLPYDDIPSYFIWLYDISFFQYALAICLVNEFQGVDFTDCPRTVNEHKLEARNDTCTEVYNAGEEWLATHNANVTMAGCFSDVVTCFDTGDDFLNEQHINPNHLGRDFLIISCYLIIVLAFGYFLLHRTIARQS